MDLKHEISVRFRLARESLSLSPPELARTIGSAPQTIRDYEDGKSIPGGAAVAGMANLGIDANWLLTGEGEMRRSSAPYTTHKSNGPIVTGSGDFAGVKAQDIHSALPGEFVLVPRYDVAGSMGNGALIHSEQIVDHLAFKADWVRLELGANPKNLVLISAVGDSMEPTLRPGDLLLVDRSENGVKQDAIYAIALGGELRIKRVQRLFDGRLIIRSDNPGYQPEEIAPSITDTVNIIGRVVWAGRRM